MNAVALSFEICAAPCWLNGLGALTTSGCLARAFAALPRAVLRAPLSSVPDGDVEDDRALAVLLRRELGGQEVGGPLAVGARQASGRWS